MKLTNKSTFAIGLLVSAGLATACLMTVELIANDPTPIDPVAAKFKAADYRVVRYSEPETKTPDLNPADYLVPAQYTPEDRAFKRANLARLAPHGPGLNEALRPVWERFVHMAAKYRDHDIAKKMFDARLQIVDESSTPYGQDLLRLYKAQPEFFVKAAKQYFNGDYGPIFSVWFDGNGNVSLIELRDAAKSAAKTKLMRRFMKAADSADQRMMAMN